MIKNKLLLRQVSKYLGGFNGIPEELQRFLEVVSESYDHYEKDRKMLERSIELTSKEMVELNNKLRKETEESAKEVYEKIRESLEAPSDYDLPVQQSEILKLAHIAELLKNETRKRRLAEKERSQREAHLKSSQQIARIGSWELDLENFKDLNNNPLYWSDETYRLFGYEPGEVNVTNELFFSHVHPDDKAAIESAVSESLKRVSIYDIEHRIVTRDGDEKLVRERAEILSDKRSGRLLKMIGTIQDVTEQKKAKQELEKANKEFKTLFENMQEAFYSVDMERYQLIQMSPACEEIYGYSVEDFKNNSNLWFDIILEEDRPAITAKEPLLHRGESIINTYRAKCKDGTIRWMESKIIPTLDNDGKLIRLDGVTSNITKRKEAEEALKNSEYLFRSMIENSSDAIMIVNEQSEVTYASNSLYRIMGYSPEEVLGKTSLSYIYSGDKELLLKHLENVIANPRKTFNLIYRRVRKDGSLIWCEGAATNFLDAPAVKGIVVNFRDITERIEYIEALKKSNEELKKSNSELDRFVYSVSHDLRAPLSSMQGVIEFMEPEAIDPAMLEDIQRLKTSINKLDTFIQDILDYSRNARLEVKNEAIDFDELLNETVEHLKFMSSGNNNIDIRRIIEYQQPFYSDKNRLGIILNNLISNALRYSDPQKSEAFIEVGVRAEGKGVNLVVRDNGVGISDENQKKVFDMFYRVSNRSIGSGLGLYIVKEAVEKLGGAIKLSSEPGLGTSIRIHLPDLLNA
jgi:PAS domain S-box-containing protein